MTISSALDVRKSLRVSYKDNLVAVHDGNELLLHGPWGQIEKMAEAFRRVARKQTPIEYAQGGQIQARAEGPHTVLCFGKWARPLSYDDLAAFASALLEAVRQAESCDVRVLNQQVADGALLLRAGAPFGISNNPRVKDAIRTEVAHNRTLRRALPFVSAKPVPDAPRVRPTSRLDAALQLHAQHAQLKKELYGKPERSAEPR